MKKHKLLSISAVIMMLSVYGCSLDEFNPSGISTEQEWSTPAGYEKKVNDCYFDLVRIVYGQAEDTYLMVAEGGTDIWQPLDRCLLPDHKLCGPGQSNSRSLSFHSLPG